MPDPQPSLTADIDHVGLAEHCQECLCPLCHDGARCPACHGRGIAKSVQRLIAERLSGPGEDW